MAPEPPAEGRNASEGSPLLGPVAIAFAVDPEVPLELVGLEPPGGGPVPQGVERTTQDLLAGAVRGEHLGGGQGGEEPVAAHRATQVEHLPGVEQLGPLPEVLRLARVVAEQEPGRSVDQHGPGLRPGPARPAGNRK